MSWQLSKIDLTYPTISKKNDISDLKCFAVSGINFNYNEFQLQFGYDNSKSFGLLDFSNKKNPKIICEGLISETNELLEKLNLPKFNFDLTTSHQITYFLIENDEDGNYDTKTNVGLIKSGDYGFPINYNSKYLINNYEYSINESEKKEIEKIILESLNQNSSQLFC